jgi:hypothetical protein
VRGLNEQRVGAIVSGDWFDRAWITATMIVALASKRLIATATLNDR